MPHLFTNRPRQYNLLSQKPAGEQHFSWESFNAILYLIGGLIFIAGSVLFLPTYQQYVAVGVYLFLIGSLVYLVVTGHDLLESISFSRSLRKLTLWNWLEFLSANVYTAGTILFIIGSIFFLPRIDQGTEGGWCFIIGSLLFLIGACINVLQIIQANAPLLLQLQNATAIAYSLGSLLFLVASIPYVWQAIAPSDQSEVFSYVAWQYITGSCLFCLGGVFNYYRAFKAVHYFRHQTARSL
jgi:hypothetical protein